MRRAFRTASTALFLGAMLASSAGCSRDECAVLRGSELVFRARRSFQTPTLLYVDLAQGQEAGDVHAEGWYLSDAHLSRIFELLGKGVLREKNGPP